MDPNVQPFDFGDFLESPVETPPPPPPPHVVSVAPTVNPRTPSSHDGVLADPTEAPLPPAASQEGPEVIEEEPEPIDAYSKVLKNGEIFPGLAVGGVLTTTSLMAAEITRVEMVSPEFASVCCLGAISAAAGRSVKLKGLRGRTSRANLYLLISARSTAGKTTVFNHAFKPIRDLENTLIEEWLKKEKPGLEADLVIARGRLKLKEKEIAKGKTGPMLKVEISTLKATIADLEVKLAPPCLVSEDFTSEALGIRLKHSNEVMTIISSDARKFLQNLLGRNTSNNETDETLLLKGWSGDPDTQIRVSRSAVSLREPCLSATVAIQDDKFEEIFRNKSITESGLAARFLSVRMTPTKQTFSVNASGIYARVAHNYDNSIRSIARAFLVPHGSSPAEIVISMTPEALQLYCDFSQECEDLAHGELNGVEMYVRRWAENAHRIALCLHISQHEAKAASIHLSEETMKHAIALQRWFNAHQLRAVRAELDRKRTQRREKLAATLQGQPDSVLSIRDLRRCGYEEEELNALVNEFPEYFQIEDGKPGAKGGRPSRGIRYVYDLINLI